MSDVAEFIKNTPFEIGTPYKDQIKAIVKAAKSPKGLTLSPTSSGKSAIIYYSTQYILNKIPDCKILVLYPTTTLIAQMEQDFFEYSGGKTENTIQQIYAFKGATKEVGKQVVFSTWQSLHKLDDSYFEQFDAVIVDEVHHGDAKCLKSIIQRCTNAVYKRGYTGTLKDVQLHVMELMGLFGPVYESITYEQLVEQNRISKCDIKIHHLEYDKTESKIVKRMNYQEEMIHIGEHKKRNEYLVKDVSAESGNKLILFQRIENHGHHLKEAFDGMKVFYVDGSIATEERDNIRKVMEENDDVILLASYQTFSTGINIKNIQHVYFASPYKSKVKVLQSIGRGLRKDGKDNHVVVHDIVDDFSLNLAKQNYCMKQFSDRLKIYYSNGFNVIYHSVKI